jgi:hypothetical protein
MRREIVYAKTPRQAEQNINRLLGLILTEERQGHCMPGQSSCSVADLLRRPGGALETLAHRQPIESVFAPCACASASLKGAGNPGSDYGLQAIRDGRGRAGASATVRTCSRWRAGVKFVDGVQLERQANHGDRKEAA